MPKYQKLPSLAPTQNHLEQFDQLPKLIARIHKNFNSSQKAVEAKNNEVSKQVAVILQPDVPSKSELATTEPISADGGPSDLSESALQESEEESLETMIKKLVYKVNQNELSQDQLQSLSSKVSGIENYLSHHLYDEMQEIRTNIT